MDEDTDHAQHAQTICANRMQAAAALLAADSAALRGTPFNVAKTTT
jgi:hypothetical protein